MSAQTSSVPIYVHGRYLWREDSRFIIRGVVYQVHGTIDPISDDHLPQLKHDVLLFKELGLNTLFVYFIDNEKTHAQAMQLLEKAGIYVFITVSTPSCTINRLSPYKSYNSTTIKSFFKTVDIMASCSNTLGLIAADELVNNDATMSAVPVIKAVVRDLKRYMKLKNEVAGQRVLPIGYNAATTSTRDKTILDYLSSDDEPSSIDFWTCKNYSWAGNSNMAQSGYNDLINQFEHVALPIFFSEYGTQLHEPRLFQETRALYSPSMSQVFSGGCVYEFWQGANGYGLVELLEEAGNTRSTAYQRARARVNDRNKVIERHQTERGLLLIYHDFVNYKEKLATARSVKVECDRGFTGREVAERVSVNTTQMRWPWEPEFSEPESCVDWGQIEEDVRKEA